MDSSHGPRRPARAARALALASLALAAWAAPGARAVDGPAPQRAGVPPAVRPVDDALCADCHPVETAGWRETGMARALEPLRPGEFDGLKPVVEEATGLVYALEETASGPRLVETLPGSDPPHEARWPLGFAVGAGMLDRSYVLAAHGRWWFAPLEVVSERASRHGESTARHAALAPPHAIEPGSRADLPITNECLACHTDRLPPERWPLNLAVEREVWEPGGVTCGACHDRAAEHAEWRHGDLAGEDFGGTDPLLAHAALSREERMSVCAACHLQGDARLELVPGRSAIPAPGSDVLDLRAVYIAAEADEEVGFVSHVERLVLSACYLESGGTRGAMVCETCHDPHRSLEAPRERGRVRAACLDCHAGDAASAGHCGLDADALSAAAGEGRDCADCHMPETPVFDVAHVRIHDHWIRTRPTVAEEADALRFAESPQGDWRRFSWPGAEPPTHAEDPGLDLMAYASRGHDVKAAALVDARPGLAAVRLPMYHHVRAGVLERLERFQEAASAYRVALALDPGLASSRTNLGLLLARVGRAEQALAELDAVVAEHPAMDSALRNRALAHRAAGDDAAFAADLETAFRLRPDEALARALADHYRASGEEGRAQRWDTAARGLHSPVAGASGEGR